jgi:hypothetical protein
MGDVGPEVNGLSQGSRMSVVAAAHQRNGARSLGAERMEGTRDWGEVAWNVGTGGDGKPT